MHDPTTRPREPSCSTQVARSALAVLLTLGSATGCHEYHDADAMPADGETLPILHQFVGTHSHDARALQYVVRDERAWSRVLLRDIPIDFNTEMLLVLTLGRRTSDQYVPSIDKVWRDRGVLRVEASVRQPDPDAPVVFASPYCIAVIPRCDLNVAGFDPEPPYRQRSWEQSPPPTEGW